MKKDLSIYIHWPWCKKKCPYCDFNSHVAAQAPEEEYVKAILTDLEYQKTLTGDRNIVSIFFGGGTPSLMKAEYIERILAKVNVLYSLDENVEITLESNPTSSNKSKFTFFKQAGINRLSIGVQSFNKDELRFLGREHNEIEAKNTVENAISIFDNVSFDLIFGLPDQSLNSWVAQLEYAIEIGTHHLSAYQLTIEPNTNFFSQVRKNKWKPMDDDRQADFFESTRELLTTHNFKHYEISNFARDGYICRHNNLIWQYGDYIGVGAGAHGRVLNQANKRLATQNYKMPDKYINAVEHVEHGIYQQYDITPKEEYKERLLMGLRTQEGVDKNILCAINTPCQPLKRLLALGMLHKNGDKIAVTKHGQLLLDSILQELLI